jgi:hypothetical protein
MDIKKVFKGLSKEEAREIVKQCELTDEEAALATSLFVEQNPRLFFCDDFGCSLGKYHYMLNRINVKLQCLLKLKLFGK